MNKDRLDKLLEKYFAGETVKAEENELRAAGMLHAGKENAFKEIGGERSKLDFQTFLTSVEEVSKEPAKVAKPIRKTTWLYAAAACLILAIAGWFIFQKKNIGNVTEAPLVLNEIPANKQQAPVAVISNTDSVAKAMPVDAQKPPAMADVKQAKKVRKELKQEQDINPEQKQNEEDYFYVMVNGIKISDPDSALSITQNAFAAISKDLRQTMNGLPAINQNDFKIQ